MLHLSEVELFVPMQLKIYGVDYEDGARGPLWLGTAGAQVIGPSGSSELLQERDCSAL